MITSFSMLMDLFPITDFIISGRLITTCLEIYMDICEKRCPRILASCPTKIMDGLASGRPFVSTAIPECKAYPEMIHLIHDAAHATGTLRALLALQWDVGFGRQQDFIELHTWPKRAEQLIGLLVDQAE